MDRCASGNQQGRSGGPTLVDRPRDSLDLHLIQSRLGQKCWHVAGMSICPGTRHAQTAAVESRPAMPDVTIRCRPNGPFLVEGSVNVVDHEGNSFPLNPDKPAIALCRCGASGNRPFCDGAHKTCGFESSEAAPT